jgi:hypothetical protein
MMSTEIKNKDEVAAQLTIAATVLYAKACREPDEILKPGGTVGTVLALFNSIRAELEDGKPLPQFPPFG